MRRAQRGMSPFAVGALVLALVVAGTWVAFKGVPFTGGGFELRAAFDNALNLQSRSVVRIAGVDVGRVTDVESDGETAIVTMELDEEALPVHADAELHIRPRMFLEGNFFIELEPGSPSAPELGEGDVIPASQTSAPVQLDEVLTTLSFDVRRDLQVLVQGFGEALDGEPRAAEDRDQDPDVRGDTAGEALNDALDDSPEALRGTALVNEALLGAELHDLSALVAGQRRVSAALTRRSGELQDLIANFNTTMAALASRQDDLRRAVALLPQVLGQANPALDRLNAAFPPTRAFAREVVPGLRETPETIDAAFPWMDEVRGLVRPAELGGLLRDLRPAVDGLSRVVADGTRLLPQIDLVSRCMTEVVLPTGDVVIQDGPLTTGVENYKEFFQALAGLSGESANFDGNGQYTRFQTGGGAYTIATNEVPGTGRLFGRAAVRPLGTRPAMPARRPPYNREKPCHENTPPNLNSARTGP